MMKKVDLTIRDVHRSSDVDRWQVVRTDQRQSLAEHSYLVAMFAAKYCRNIGISYEIENEAIRCALYHDLPEVLTGDIVAPVKELIDTKKLREWEERIEIMGDTQGFGPKARFIVKMADITEAIVWLDLHGVGDHAWAVRQKLYKRAHQIVEDSGTIIATLFRDNIDPVIEQATKGKQSFIDELSDE